MVIFSIVQSGFSRPSDQRCSLAVMENESILLQIRHIVYLLVPLGVQYVCGEHNAIFIHVYCSDYKYGSSLDGNPSFAKLSHMRTSCRTGFRKSDKVVYRATKALREEVVVVDEQVEHRSFTQEKAFMYIMKPKVNTDFLFLDLVKFLIIGCWVFFTFSFHLQFDYKTT